VTSGTMRFLYVTDFHGDRAAYEESLRVAVDHRASAIVNGGDLLPHGRTAAMTEGRAFVPWLRGHFAEARSAGLRTLAMFGNDDPAGLLPEFDALASEGVVERLDRGVWIEIGGWSFLGYPFIPDPPFRLKDWSRLDDLETRCGFQFGPPLVSKPTGVEKLDVDAQTYLERFPTIEDDLRGLPAPPDAARAAFVMHSPPAGLDLDVCMDGTRVGSRAGRRFIESSGLALSLHGHVHESPRVTGRWFAKLGRATAVNPGAIERPEWVFVDTDARTLEHSTRGIATF